MSLVEQIIASGRRIVVLCGGCSTEREVSLVSGKAVAGALQETGLPFELLELEQNRLPDSLDNSRHLVLPVIHGKYGEDGALSAELDQRGIPYAGCAQAASVLCYDKLASKAIASRLGIPVARDLHILPDTIPGFEECRKHFGLPFIIKPRFDGSSVGLYLISDVSEYDKSLSDLRQAPYLAEEFISGTDLTVGILQDEALGVVAIRPKGGLYDYQHKYQSGMSEYQAPAEIDPEFALVLRNWSKSIFHTCGCRDLARVDFRMTDGGQAYFLEINTIPGMTPTSLLPKSALCNGVSFNQLVLTWAGIAYNRSRESD